MTRITRQNLERYLRERPHDELLSDLLHFFGTVDAVREFYQQRLGGGPSEELLAKYKAAIQREFFPPRGIGQARLSIARKPITEYKKVAASPDGVVDLMLFYVEMGVQYTNTYGDITEAFYNSMESMYGQALRLIAKHGLHDQLAVRCRKIVSDASSVGWGFPDILRDLYYEYFDV